MNKDKLNIYTYLSSKYINLYTSHIYELSEFFPKIGFPGKSIFKLLIWVIFLTDLLSNLVRDKPFEIEKDSTTLFNQSIFNLDHEHLYLHRFLSTNIGVAGGISVLLRSAFLRIGIAFNTRYTSFCFEILTITF